MLFAKKITAQELGELRAINNIIRQREYVYNNVAKNSYHVHKGQQWLKSEADVIKLLKNSQSEFVQLLSHKYGFGEGFRVSIDLSTGKLDGKKEVNIDPPANDVKPVEAEESKKKAKK